MSIASEITRINTNIAAAYTACDGKGATMPQTQNSANLADTIGSISSTPTLQEKSATPTASAQVIEPDSGYDGLLRVNIAATSLEAATVTPTTQQQTITPTAPAIGFSNVTVEGYVPPEPLIEKDVNFYDYDGTVLYSYTKAEFLALESFPTAPTHEGLTFQEWNWSSLQAIKDYVTEYGVCDVGATYLTDNGSTRLFLAADNSELLNDLTLYVLMQNGTLTISIDGTVVAVETETSANANVSHTIPLVFTHPVHYPTTLIVEMSFQGQGYYILGQGSIATRVFGFDSQKNSMVEKIHVGNSCRIGSSGLFALSSLKCISLPNNIVISSSAFQQCSQLSCIVLPLSLLSIIGTNIFSGCSALKRVVFSNAITAISHDSFNGCNSIKRITLPNSLTNVQYGQFQGCRSLVSILLHNALTSIENSLLYSCQSLNSIYIPKSISNIGTQAFSQCTLLFTIDLSAYDDPSSIPTLNNVNTFSYTPSDKVFFVKNQEMLDAFTTAKNWSTYSDRFQIKGA